jgi:hypothetical protein
MLRAAELRIRPDYRAPDLLESSKKKGLRFFYTGGLSFGAAVYAYISLLASSSRCCQSLVHPSVLKFESKRSTSIPGQSSTSTAVMKSYALPFLAALVGVAAGNGLVPAPQDYVPVTAAPASMEKRACAADNCLRGELAASASNASYTSTSTNREQLSEHRHSLLDLAALTALPTS